MCLKDFPPSGLSLSKPSTSWSRENEVLRQARTNGSGGSASAIALPSREEPDSLNVDTAVVSLARPRRPLLRRRPHVSPHRPRA